MLTRFECPLFSQRQEDIYQYRAGSATSGGFFDAIAADAVHF
jgi:hypothetical protein